jgi:hypothetical protein
MGICDDSLIFYQMYAMLPSKDRKKKLTSCKYGMDSVSSVPRGASGKRNSAFRILIMVGHSPSAIRKGRKSKLSFFSQYEVTPTNRCIIFSTDIFQSDISNNCPVRLQMTPKKSRLALSMRSNSTRSRDTLARASDASLPVRHVISGTIRKFTTFKVLFISRCSDFTDAQK